MRRTIPECLNHETIGRLSELCTFHLVMCMCTYVFRNCLFRALGDQLDGGRTRHSDLRQEVVRYIQSHRDEFEPFLDEDEPFDEYGEGMWCPPVYVTSCHVTCHGASTSVCHIMSCDVMCISV